ncbi:MAG: arginine deiminase family protein [Sulfolobales archaeon]
MVKWDLNSTKPLFSSVIVRKPTEDVINCVSSHPLRHTVDYTMALKQHDEYVKVLREEGIEVIQLPKADGFPDAVFIQDTGVIRSLKREALISNFGIPSRRGEEKSVANYLKELGYNVVYVKEPATIEGGDILITDAGIIYVGITSRTNLGGYEYLRTFFRDHDIIPLKSDKVFHLLSAVTYLGSKTLALVPELVDATAFEGFKIIRIPFDEAYAVNMLYLGEGKVLVPEGYTKTYNKLRSNGFKPIEVDVSEFRKCDGGVTCLNLPLYNL